MPINQYQECIVVVSSLRAGSPRPASLAVRRLWPQNSTSDAKNERVQVGQKRYVEYGTVFSSQVPATVKSNNLYGVSSRFHALSRSNAENDFQDIDMY